MPDFLTYYPNQKYLDRKWAGEKVSLADLMALAGAEKMARAQGILSPSMASRFLPNQLVEGRFGGEESFSDFGVNRYGYPPTSARDQAMKRMGIKVGAFNPPPESADWGDAEWDAFARTQPFYEVLRQKDGYTINDPETGNLYAQENAPRNYDYRNTSAKLAALMLAEKAREYGENNAVTRWNGSGRVVKNGKVWADADNHSRKVGEMMMMLQRPENAAIWNKYQELLK